MCAQTNKSITFCVMHKENITCYSTCLDTTEPVEHARPSGTDTLEEMADKEKFFKVNSFFFDSSFFKYHINISHTTTNFTYFRN